MKQLIPLIAAALMLGGCIGDRTDLEAFVTSTKLSMLPGSRR